jgi:hypothetical protein
MGARIGTAVLIATAVTLGGGRTQAGDYDGATENATTAPYRIDIAYQDDTRAAFDADRVGNYAEALRLFRKLDAEGRVAGSPANLAAAREKIGEYYEKGLGGLGQDYRAAASWYEKAIDGGPSIRATIRLGFLYANGLGRPQDRAKARELFVSAGPSFQTYVTLLDHNMLPKSDEDVRRSDFEKSKRAPEEKAALMIHPPSPALAPLNTTVQGSREGSCPSPTTAFSICLSSVETNINTHYGQYNCTISAKVNNNTANHLDEFAATTKLFPISVKNVRAYAKYDFTFRASASCADVVRSIQSSPDFYNIDRCDMSGIREGDCLNMVSIRSAIPPTQGAQSDTSALVQCRADLPQCARHQACLDTIPCRGPVCNNFDDDARRICGELSERLKTVCVAWNEASSCP